MFSVLAILGIRPHHPDLDGSQQRNTETKTATKIVCRDESKVLEDHLNLTSVSEPVIAVCEQEDGFADVSVRPLTYAEVAGLGTKMTRSAGHLTLPIEEYEDSDELSGDADSTYSGGDSSMTSRADDADDRLLISVDVIAHEQYGDRAEANQEWENRRYAPRKTLHKRREKSD